MVIYVSMRFETDIGSRVHRSILEELYGRENIYVVDLRPRKYEKKENYICYGKYKRISQRLHRWAQGNTMNISNRIIREICGIVRRTNAELVFFENSTFGNLVREIKRRSPRTKTVCFYHDIDADLFRQHRKRARLRDKIEFTIGIRQEAVCQKYADIHIVFHDRDAGLYEKYYGKQPDYRIPLSSYIEDLDEEFLKMPPSSKDARKKLLFVGTKYYPNVEGIRWFYENILPELNENIELYVVGRGMEFLSDEFTDKRVHVPGTVDDVFPYLYDADIFIAPLFGGGGMKTKTVEAISLGKCIVGNEESLVGFWEEMDETVRDTVIFNCTTADDWIRTINALSGQEIRKFNPALYQIFLKKFSYARTREELRQALDVQEPGKNRDKP